MLIIARCTPTLLSAEIILLIYGSGMSRSVFCSFFPSRYPPLFMHPEKVLFNLIPFLLIGTTEAKRHETRGYFKEVNVRRHSVAFDFFYFFFFEKSK